MNKPILDKSISITRGALPGSRKLMIEGVPFREVPLSGGEPAVRLYDTSGPYTDETVAIDIEKGLASRRGEWIRARGDVEAYAGRNVTQLHYARQGIITEEMKFIASRENLGRSKLADGNSFGAAIPSEI